MKCITASLDLKEKIRNIANLTNQLMIKQGLNESILLYEEISEIWRHLSKIESFETKSITEVIVNMSIAFEAYLVGAITKEELLTCILRNKAVSELINNIEAIS